MKPTTTRRNAKSGYTLTELIVVIIILGLLAAFVAPTFFSQIGNARQGTAETQIQYFAQALDQYRLETGSYPDAGSGLSALVQAPAGVADWNGPYLRGERTVPTDPWGNEYIYEVVGPGHIILSSYGQDGREGGEDENADIVRELF